MAFHSREAKSRSRFYQRDRKVRVVSKLGHAILGYSSLAGYSLEFWTRVGQFPSMMEKSSYRFFWSKSVVLDSPRWGRLAPTRYLFRWTTLILDWMSPRPSPKGRSEDKSTYLELSSLALVTNKRTNEAADGRNRTSHSRRNGDASFGHLHDSVGVASDNDG